MKRFSAMILASVIAFASAALAAFADDVPQEPLEPIDEYVEILYGPAGSDETGDYVKLGGVKAYGRLNEGMVDVRIEGGVLHVYDLNGKELALNDGFSLSAHPWIQAIIDEYVVQNTVIEDGVEIIPDVGILVWTEPEEAAEEPETQSPTTGVSFTLIPAFVSMAAAVASRKR